MFQTGFPARRLLRPVLALVLMALPAFGQVYDRYARVYGGDREERALDITELKAGCTARLFGLAGYTKSYGPPQFKHPMMLTVVSDSGNVRWCWVGSDTADGEFRTVTKSTDSSFVAAGWTNKYPTGPDLLVAKFGVAGNISWAKVYQRCFREYALSIAPTFDTGTIICGSTTSDGPDTPNVVVMKLDRYGNKQWARAYWIEPNLGTDQATGIVALPPGASGPRYAITGRTQVFDSAHYDAFVFQINSVGIPIDSACVTNSPDEEEAASIAAVNDTLVVAGWTNHKDQGKSADIFVWTLSAAKTQTYWLRTYGHLGVDDKVLGNHCLTVAPCPTGPFTKKSYRFLVDGWTLKTPAPSGTDFLYFTLNSNGSLFWQRRHPSQVGLTPFTEAGYSALIASNNRLAMTGYSFNTRWNASEDMHLLVTNRAGMLPSGACTALDTLELGELGTVKRAVGCTTFICEPADYPMDWYDVPTKVACKPKQAGWITVEPVPLGPKPLKSGGSLVAQEDVIYALVGNNTRQFYAYDPAEGVWAARESLPAGERNKRVKTGAGLASDGGSVYAVKGNNTQEFFGYQPEAGIWTALASPTFSKGIKGGAMACATTAAGKYLYLVNGSNTNEWARYNIRAGAWEPAVPATLPAEKFKVGTGLVNQDSMLYLLRAGGKTNEFYALNLNADSPTWLRKRDLPLVGVLGRKKKVGEGGSLVASVLDGRLYVLKGNNTLEFWQYDPAADTWYQQPDLGQPSGVPIRRVKGGGSLAYSPFDDAIYATGGNNSNEFWCFTLPRTDTLFAAGRSLPGSQSRSAMPRAGVMHVRNPVPGDVRVFCSLPAQTRATLQVFSPTGRELTRQQSTGGSFLVRHLPAGVYLLKLTAPGINEERKITVVR